jgi:hypothetical protein
VLWDAIISVRPGATRDVTAPVRSTRYVRVS